MLLDADSGADFSPTRTHRYRLWRVWDEKKPTLNLIGCNPSTAAEVKNDPTATKVIGLAQELGFGRLDITNVFSFVATDPKKLRECWRLGMDVVGQGNDLWLVSVAKAADMVICGWGLNGHIAQRCIKVEEMLRLNHLGPKLHYLRLCKDGTPEHLLYIPGGLRPRVLPIER